MTRSQLLLLLLAVGAALALRLPQLDRRPMHNDEAVNAVKLGQLLDTGRFRYDPDEHHGPTLFYATAALARVTGAKDSGTIDEARLRGLTVVFGIGLVLLLPLLTDALGRNGTVWAAIFTAVSPAFVFYSRYYIHEILLVFFALLALAAGWRYWQSRKIGWAILAGAAFGLMQATKETFVISLFCAVLALGLCQAWNHWLEAGEAPLKAPRWNLRHLLAGLAAWIVVSVVLFSSFFTNPAGPLDSILTYRPWIGRAGGATLHQHPWHFYLDRLLFFHAAKGVFWTEALLLILALVAGWAGFARKHLGRTNAGMVRFLFFYSFGLMAFYSLLPYKTPWCLLNFWQGIVLLAGVGAAVLARRPRRPLASNAVGCLLLAGAAHLAWESWQADTVYAADQRNPYVYAQTSPDLLNLVEKVESLAETAPQGQDLLVKVIAPEGDYWPLPWYLRSFRRVGYWEQLPEDPYAPVMIVSAGLKAALDANKTHLMVGYFQLRPRVFLELYVEKELWTAWLAKHPPKPD